VELGRIFKAYDIRGLVPDEFDGDVAERIGAAFAVFTGAARIAVGHDARISSPVLADALISGITGAGCDVDSLGMIATDMAYHAAGMLGEPAAMITASHNPKGWNGVKLCLAGAAPVGADSGLEEIRRLAESEAATVAVPGKMHRTDTKKRYLDHVLAVAGAHAIG